MIEKMEGVLVLMCHFGILNLVGQRSDFIPYLSFLVGQIPRTAY